MASSTWSALDAAASGAHNSLDSTQKHSGSFEHRFLLGIPPHLLSPLDAGVVATTASGAHNSSDSFQKHSGSFEHCFLLGFPPHLLSPLAAGVNAVTTVPGAL